MKNSRVLVVDDIPENIQFLLNSLKDEYIVLAATNGEKALEIASMEPFPDIIILDILMPEMTGYEVCERLKQNPLTAHIPVIFISVLDDTEAILKGFEVGGEDYISKPFNIEEMLTRVRTRLLLFEERNKLQAQLLVEKKERERQKNIMLQQEKMAAMGEMIALIAHQWRQPLSAINVVVADIRLKEELDARIPSDKLIDYMKNIEQSVGYLSNTINDFRNFFKADKVYKEVYINNIFDKVLGFLEHNLRLQSIVINNEIGPSQKSIFAFENELVQVFLNLFKNSLDAFKGKEIPNPTITIRCKEYDTFQQIIVEDNAGGANPEVLHQIFGYGFTTKQESDGTGLGLYMSKIIIEEHHKGKIEAKPIKDGIAFYIDIPYHGE